MLQKISENFLLKSAAYIVAISLSYKTSYLIFKRVFARIRDARNMKKNNCMTVDELYKFAKQQNKEFLIIKDTLIQGISSPHNNRYLTYKNQEKKFMKLNVFTDHRIYPFPYLQAKCKRENVPYFQLISDRSKQFLVVDLCQSNSLHPQSVRKIVKNRKYVITTILEQIVGRASDCGVYFGSMIFLRGDFIYLKGSGILRCFKPQLFGLKSNMMSNSICESIVLSIWGLLIGSIAIGVSLLYLAYLYSDRDVSILAQNVKCANFQTNMACIECKKEEINIILTPCYHFLYCELCSINKKHCQACNREVDDRIKIYKG